jgi:hypothetical protein
MKEIKIIPPLRTVTKGGMPAVVEYLRSNDPVDKFRGTVEIDEFGSEKDVLWGAGGISRDLPDAYNLTKDSPGFIELRARYLQR